MSKEAEYIRLMAGRRPPPPLVEKWERVDGKPLLRKLPLFMARLNNRMD